DATAAERSWTDLTSNDGPRSRRARWDLVAGGDATVQFLAKRLRRVEPLEPRQVAMLIARLDSDAFEERQAATHELERTEPARSALEDTLRRNPSLEMRRRIETILAKFDAAPWDADAIRPMRAVLLLEQIGTPAARQLLQTLATGATSALVTEETQAALGR